VPVEVESIPDSVAAWDLGAGESEGIAAALSRPGVGVVIDDLAGRKCALSQRLDVIGTLGVVVGAHRRGLVEDPAVVFAELRNAGMWLSQALIDRVATLAARS
jgi:predicted nucleic acid-binding protein